MAAPFELPALPYDDTFLAPVIGQQTVQLHHGKHHATYFAKLNPLVEGTEMADMSLEDVVKASFGKADMKGVFNNAGQAWNHIFLLEPVRGRRFGCFRQAQGNGRARLWFR